MENEEKAKQELRMLSPVGWGTMDIMIVCHKSLFSKCFCHCCSVGQVMYSHTYQIYDLTDPFCEEQRQIFQSVLCGLLYIS